MEIMKELRDSMESVEDYIKKGPMDKVGQAPPGLVPQSGNPQKPVRWIKPEDMQGGGKPRGRPQPKPMGGKPMLDPASQATVGSDPASQGNAGGRDEARQGKPPMGGKPQQGPRGSQAPVGQKPDRPQLSRDQFEDLKSHIEYGLGRGSEQVREVFQAAARAANRKDYHEARRLAALGSLASVGVNIENPKEVYQAMQRLARTR